MFNYTRQLGYVLVALAVVVFFGCDSGGSSNEEEPPPEPSGAEVTVAEDATLGEYLADGEGFSLYLFVDEEGNPAPCTTDECLGAWPPFLTEGEPTAGEGVDAALLSTTEGPEGGTQVVYNGWPLWYFAGDEASGDVNGQGIVSFGGTWLLVTPAGDGIESADVTVAENESVGEYLADGDGVSVYLFTDGNGNPVSCTGECLDNWPVFTVEGEPTAGEGVDASLLSTTEGPEGGTQAVYNGWPLYYFANDTGSGDINGHGIGSADARWHLISPAGSKIAANGGDAGNDGGDDGQDY